MTTHQKDSSVGIIPIHLSRNREVYFCLVKHSLGHWGFPKGHKNEGESDIDAARRELAEETGIKHIDIKDNVTFAEKYSFEKDGITYNKIATYFLGFVSDRGTETHPDFRHEIHECVWVDYEKAKGLLTFKEARNILEKACKHI